MTSSPGMAIWLTGLPGAGKSTLAEGLAYRLQERGWIVQVLDSDQMRSVLTPAPTYTVEEREWFYRAVAFIVQLLTQNGVTVLIAATANRRRFRDYARQQVELFTEVYVKCSLKTCMERDEKGVYEKALGGQATTVPGLQAPYEPPRDPAVVVDTEWASPEEGVQQILESLEAQSFLGGACLRI